MFRTWIFFLRSKAYRCLAMIFGIIQIFFPLLVSFFANIFNLFEHGILIIYLIKPTRPRGQQDSLLSIVLLCYELMMGAGSPASLRGLRFACMHHKSACILMSMACMACSFRTISTKSKLRATINV